VRRRKEPAWRDRSGVPDLVVLDLNMPEEDGLRSSRDLKSRTNIPVIMLTATASPIDRVVGLELGADDYVAKPCELRELMARITFGAAAELAGQGGAGRKPRPPARSPRRTNWSGSHQMARPRSAGTSRRRRHEASLTASNSGS